MNNGRKMVNNRRTLKLNHRTHKTNCWENLWSKIKEHILLILTFSGVLFGGLLGFYLRRYKPSDDTIMLIAFPGDILMRMLKMLILPLIISSLITGVAVLDPKSSGRIGLYAMLYYLTTTLVAAVLGIFLVIAIKPGDKDTRRSLTASTIQSTVTTQDAIMDLIRNLFPENLVQAALQQGSTVYTYEEKRVYRNITNTDLVNNSIGPEMKRIFSFQYNDNTNVLGIIAFCVAFGMLISNMGRKAEILLHLFMVLNEIIMQLVKIIMWYSPFGILSLVCGKILDIEDVGYTARKLGLYMATVITGLLIHCFMTLCLIYFVILRKNPYKFYYGLLQAIITGFGTSSR
jgi:solute carrier family 1 (glial high affinity glutamate transporter), member 2